MNSANITFLALVLAVAIPSSVYSSLPIGGDPISLGRITTKMCQGVNATAAQAFWDCYSVAPVSYASTSGMHAPCHAKSNYLKPILSL